MKILAQLSILVTLAVLVCGDVKKLLVEIIYEPTNEHSKRLIQQQVDPAMEKLSEYVDLRLNPYGLSKTIRDSAKIGLVFECTGGPLGCRAGKLQGCVLYNLPCKGDQTKKVKLIGCIMNGVPDLPIFAIECMKDLGITIPTITLCGLIGCTDGEEGKQIFRAFGKKVEDLEEKPRYVPWVLIQGKHDAAAEVNFEEAVCGYLDNNPELCAKYRPVPDDRADKPETKAKVGQRTNARVEPRTQKG